MGLNLHHDGHAGTRWTVSGRARGPGAEPIPAKWTFRRPLPDAGLDGGGPGEARAVPGGVVEPDRGLLAGDQLRQHQSRARPADAGCAGIDLARQRADMGYLSNQSILLDGGTLST
jgi:hypothetical protein